MNRRTGLVVFVAVELLGRFAVIVSVLPLKTPDPNIDPAS